MVDPAPFLQIVMTGMGTGFGSALGSFFATKYALKELKKVKKISKIVKKVSIKKPEWRMKMMRSKEVKTEGSKFGSWAFIVGVLLAVIAGFFTLNAWLVSILGVLGIFVGIFNITSEETHGFLLAGTCLVIVTALGGNFLANIAVVGDTLARIFGAVMTFTIPSVVIVCLKNIFDLSRD